ncbi:MFS transporter [Paraburkholderia tropica]|uniref:MFS transporter n=1 Tax=Paraburkholderia tropica TaxID=92647 RepID=UPI002AB6660F|nr:MFS transporter [Paraburkholderia tropica]
MNGQTDHSIISSSNIPTRLGRGGTEKQQLNRVVIAAMAGSIIEWFEFSVYGYLAAVMGQVFFSSSTATVQIIASLATFAIAFLARPFGGAICGLLGDKYGRKSVLNTTLFVMAAATFAIGLIPSQASIGIAAPSLLVLMRLLQGLSAGGEVSAAAIFVAEQCEDRHRTLMTAWVEVGAMAGFLFGAAVSFILHQCFTDAQLTAWAWRIPFFFAAPLAYIGLYIRRKLEESELFTKAQREGKVGRLSMAQQLRSLGAYKGVMLQAAGMVIVTNITLFTVLTYLPTYLNKDLHLTGGHALAMSLAPMALLVVLIPVFAAIADRVGRKPMMITGSICVLLLAIPLFQLLRSGNVMYQMFALTALNVFLAMLTSCIFAQIPSLFPLKVRFMAMAISYNVTIALFAGTAPMINAWLVGATGNQLMPAYYMMSGCVLGLFALFVSHDRTGASMADD